MPIAHANGIDIYYEEHGSGEPLLLIMGWGCNAATWTPQLPGLAERFRVIAFDNRGAGRTSAPPGPYTIGLMEQDTVGLLDAIGLERAHVFGISMGGMIAQKLALRHPQRVGALMLGCTSPGGRRAAGSGELRKNIRSFEGTVGSDGPDLEWFADFLKQLWTDDALARSDPHLQDFVFSLIRFPPPPHGLNAQAKAVAAFDVYERLQYVRHHTLVMTGNEDRLIAFENAFLLAKRIPNAELRIFPGLKHAFHLERPEAVNATMIDFIDRVTAQQAAERAPAAARQN